MAGRPEIYGPLMATLMAGNASIGAIRHTQRFTRRPANDVLQAAALLIMNGYAHPLLPVGLPPGPAPTDRHGNAGRRAGDAGGAGDTGGRAREIEGLTYRLLAELLQAGRTVQHDGKTVTDMA